MEEQSAFIDFNIWTNEYELKNDKKVFCRIERDFVAAWCKDNEFKYITANDDSSTINPFYVRMFFAMLIFDGLDLNQMTDAHVVGKALGF